MYWVSLGFLGLVIIMVTIFHPLTGALAFMVLALPVLGLALGLAGTRAVTYRRVLSKDHVFPGETVDVELVLRNRSPLPLPWVAVVDRVGSREVRPSFQAVGLGPFSTKRVRYSFVPDRRGYFQVGPLTISSGDFLGGPVFERQVDGVEHITVYPRTIPMDELTLWSRIPAGDLRRRDRLIEDPSRYAGLREYVGGDPQSRIHWKATARAGRLLTRRFDATISQETMIVLAVAVGDFETRYSDALMELGIEIAASLAFHLVTRRQKVGFATNGVAAGSGTRIGSIMAYPCRSGAGHLMQLFEVMARLGPGEGPLAADLLRLAGRDLRWGSTCMVVAPSDTDDLIHEALALVRRGADVTIVATTRARHAEHLGGTGKGGLSVVEVRSSQALRERLGR
ncbi:MAG: DUF58 domain-containing protein [Firmicutes bacterium]|nr:DUF58 domain-containing protein [Bacillota bacterium]